MTDQPEDLVQIGDKLYLKWVVDEAKWLVEMVGGTLDDAITTVLSDEEAWDNRKSADLNEPIRIIVVNDISKKGEVKMTNDPNWEMTPELIKMLSELLDKAKLRWREKHQKDIDHLRKQEYYFEGEKGELVGIIGRLTGIGVQLRPLFKISGGKYFSGHFKEGVKPRELDLSIIWEVDISQSGDSFKFYTIEEFLNRQI